MRGIPKLAAVAGDEKLEQTWQGTAEEIRADILEHGARDGVLRQHYDTDALDASTLLIPLVRFLPPDLAERMFRAVARSIVEGGLLILSSHDRELDNLRRPSGIFQRRGPRFIAVRDIGEGLPHRELLLGLDLGDG